MYYDEGVDFDSADGNIHCSIFIDPLTPEWNPRAGCGMDSWDFEFPVVPYLDTERAGNATVIHGAEPGLVFAHSDAPYAGQDPISNPTVGTLHPGETITSVGISCEALTDAIRCTNTTSEHGFLISRDSYELF